MVPRVGCQVDPPRDERKLVPTCCRASWFDGGMWAGSTDNAAINTAITPAFEAVARQLILVTMHTADTERPPATSGVRGAAPRHALCPQRQRQCADDTAARICAEVVTNALRSAFEDKSGPTGVRKLE